MYLNYGDVDFFEHGVLVEHDDDIINILYCVPYDGDGYYLFAHCYVDVNDSWINREDVINFSGFDEDNIDLIQFAIACIEYYGIENFSSPYDGYIFTKKEIEDKLKDYQIQW